MVMDRIGHIYLGLIISTISHTNMRFGAHECGAFDGVGWFPRFATKKCCRDSGVSGHIDPLRNVVVGRKLGCEPLRRLWGF